MNSVSFIIRSAICIAVMAFIGLSSPISAQSKKARNEARTLQAQGDRAYQQKNYREAIDTYAQSIALVPNNPDVRYRKGYAHFNLDETVPALNEFAIALSQGFKPLEIYRVRSYIYYQQKDHEKALEDIQSALVLEPRDLSFLKMLGELNLEKNDISGALSAFKRAADVAPADADVDYNLAKLYYATGNFTAQAASSEAALKKGTRFPGETYFLIADAYQKLGRAADSIEAYKRAINAKPDIYLAYRNLAEVYRSENRYEDAITVSRQGLRAFPNDGNIYTDLSWYYSLADRPQDAVDAAKAGVAMLPKEHMAYTNLCRAYNETKQYNLAIGACNGALQLKPGDGESYFYLGRAYNLTGRNSEATKYYRLAVTGLLETTQSLPDYSDAWYLLGNAYFADNQREKAAEAYRRCLAISPKFAKARYNLGMIHVLAKDKPAALEQHDRLVPLDERLANALKAEIDKTKF